MPIGWAGGWAWEAPRVSMIVPLPQHFQGLNSFGSCCLVGAPPELTRVCYRLVHQETHTLSLSLLLEHTQPCTPIFKHTLTIPKKANTHKSAPPSTNPEGLCTPIWRLRAIG